MRIGFDAKRLFCNFTGLGNHGRTTIDILTEYFPENEYVLYTPKMRLNDTTRPYLKKSGCRVVQPHGVFGGSVWRTLCLPELCRKDEVTLFHGLSNELPVGIRKSGIPSVVTIHDVAFRTFTDMYHWQDRKIYDMKWRYAVTHSDRIIAISECTKRDIIRFYDVDESKIDVVYQPVGVGYYEERPEMAGDSPAYMLYVGSVNSRKNLLGVLKAMELMPRDVLIPLVVVGGGREYMAECKEYAARQGLEKWIDWRGNVPSAELPGLYAEASMFVYPSFYEGFGLPVVEAMLSGCPVVTSNVSCLPEAAGPYSQLCDPSDPSDIADKMTQVLTDTELRKAMIAGSRKYAMETFHPQVLAQNLMKVYNKTL